MSVKHIDYLKIKPSKFLTVEIRPIRCLIDTPSGLTRTAKWMTHEHWKELRLLLNEIADHYEEEKQMLKVTQDLKCNEHNLKNGKLIRIGYMFVANCSCSCHYLVPRDDATWTDDEDEENSSQHRKLKDKGGKYKPLTPCAERLVVSVRLQEVKPKSSSQSREDPPARGGAGPMSPMAADKQLVKALDRSFVVTNTISDYFTSGEKASQESVLSSVPRQSASPDTTGTDEQRKLRNMAVKSRLRRQKRKRDPTEAKDSNSDNINPIRRQVKKSMFDTSSEGVVEDDGNVNRYREQTSKFCASEKKKLFCDSKEGIKKEVTSIHEWIKNEEVSVSSEWMEREIFNHVSPDKRITTCNSLSRCEKEFNSSDKDFDPEVCVYARNSEYSAKNETDLVSTKNNHVSVGYNTIKTETDDDVSWRVTEEPFDCFDRYVRGFNKSHVRSNLTFSTDDDGKESIHPNLISKYQSTPVYHPSNLYEKGGEKWSPKALSPIVGRKQKHICETTDSFMFSSSSQVRKNPHHRRLRQCSDEDSPRRIEAENTSSNHTNMSEQPLSVKIPLKHLHNTSLSPEVQSPVKGRVAKTKSKRINALFGDSEETPQEEQTSNLDEEYVPTAHGSEQCDNGSTFAQTSFNPSPIVQTSDSVNEMDSTDENLSCRRSKRLRGKEWMSPYLYSENIWRISPSKKTIQTKKNGEMEKLLQVTNDEMLNDSQVSDSQMDTEEEVHSSCEKKKRTKVSPSKKMLQAKKVVRKVKKELQIMNEEVLNDSQLTDSQKERELLDLPWEKKERTKISPSKKTLQAKKEARKVKKEQIIMNDEMLNDSQLTDSQKERELLHSPCEKKKRTKTSPSKKMLQAKKVVRKVKMELQMMNDEVLNDSQLTDSQKERELLDLPWEKKLRTKVSPSKKTLPAKKEVRKVKKELQMMNDEVLNDSQLTDSQKERELLDLPWEKKERTKVSPSKKTVQAKKVDSWEIHKTRSTDDSQLTDLSESTQKHFKLKKKKLRISEPSKTKTTKINRQVKQKLPKNELSDQSQSLNQDSCSQKRVVKKHHGKVKNRIIESERVKEAKKLIRAVEKEMAEMSTHTLDDETLSLTPVISNSKEEVSFNCEKKKKAESPVKRKYKKKATKMVSNQPTLKDCLMMKSLTMATDSKKCQRHSSKGKGTNNFSDKDMFADSSVTNDSCESDFNEVSGPISASGHGPQNTSDSLFTDDSYSQRFSDVDDLPALEISEGDQHESHSPSAVNVQSPKGNDDRRGSLTDSDDSALSPVEDAARFPSLLEESQGHTSNQAENSVIVTEERPNTVSTALQLCGQKLKNTSLQELEDRLTEAHPYLSLIMKGKGSNARHDIFKEDGRACREMFNELVYGAFLEEQIEFAIEYLQKKYLVGLTGAMKDSSRSRRYLWKVLAPSFFIKLVMDNEDVDHDIAEHILSEISLHLD